MKGYDPSIPIGQQFLRLFCIPVPAHDHTDLYKIDKIVGNVFFRCNLQTSSFIVTISYHIQNILSIRKITKDSLNFHNLFVSVYDTMKVQIYTEKQKGR